jgi:RNase P/RNase MRP subunit POP5
VDRRVVVVRTSLVMLGAVRASIASVVSVAGVDCAVHVLGVSGTIKALRKSIG